MELKQNGSFLRGNSEDLFFFFGRETLLKLPFFFLPPASVSSFHKNLRFSLHLSFFFPSLQHHYNSQINKGMKTTAFTEKNGKKEDELEKNQEENAVLQEGEEMLEEDV